MKKCITSIDKIKRWRKQTGLESLVVEFFALWLQSPVKLFCSVSKLNSQNFLCILHVNNRQSFARLKGYVIMQKQHFYLIFLFLFYFLSFGYYSTNIFFIFYENFVSHTRKKKKRKRVTLNPCLKCLGFLKQDHLCRCSWPPSVFNILKLGCRFWRVHSSLILSSSYFIVLYFLHTKVLPLPFFFRQIVRSTSTLSFLLRLVILSPPPSYPHAHNIVFRESIFL